MDEWAAGLSMSLASSDGSETNKRKILDFVKFHIRLCATDSKAESLRYVTILLGCPTLLLAAQIHFRSDILAGDQFNFNCYHFVVRHCEISMDCGSNSSSSKSEPRSNACVNRYMMFTGGERHPFVTKDNKLRLPELLKGQISVEACHSL